MDAAVNPEVAAAEKAEAARKEELRKEQVKALAVSTTTLLFTACLQALTAQQLNVEFFWLLLYTQHGDYRQQLSEHAQALLSALCHVACMPVQPFLFVACGSSACQ